MDPFANPILDLEILVELLDNVVDGSYRRDPKTGDLRVYRKFPFAGPSDVLWRLRHHHLVEWGEAHYYLGSRAVREVPGPLPILTDVGRRLALAQL